MACRYPPDLAVLVLVQHVGCSASAPLRYIWALNMERSRWLLSRWADGSRCLPCVACTHTDGQGKASRRTDCEPYTQRFRNVLKLVLVLVLMHMHASGLCAHRSIVAASWVELQGASQAWRFAYLLLK